MSSKIKKKLFFFLRVAEEGFTYYLIFKWFLFVIATIISAFITVLLRLFFDDFVFSHFGWNSLFFLIWCIVFLIFIYEFPVPSDQKNKFHDDVSRNEDEKKHN